MEKREIISEVKGIIRWGWAGKSIFKKSSQKREDKLDRQKQKLNNAFHYYANVAEKPKKFSD